MTAAITIDVDSLRFYREIHGLPEGDPARDPIYDVALPRFYELLERVGAPATLFLVGEDAARFPTAFAPVADLGCEIASHSYAHDYRMTERTREAIDQDLDLAESALRPLAPNGAVEGFRAPGYNTSPAMLSAVAARGYLYDSSLLPAPLYWTARAAAIGRYALSGRPSRSLVGRFGAFAGPLRPYRTQAARPWKEVVGGEILEIPIACEPTSRLPVIGTSWVLMPAPLRGLLLRRMIARLPVVNFEMHAIDLLDGTDTGVTAELTRAQPDLRVPVREKMAAFEMLFRRLADERGLQTLAAIARATSPESR